MRIRRIRLIAAVMTLALLVSAVPAALASGSFQAVVVKSSMKVYAESAPHRYIGSLSKGTVVTVEKYAGKAALISLNGKRGIARVSDMKAATGEARAEEQAPQTPSEIAVNKTVVTNRATRVYKKPKTSSKFVSVRAGTEMTLVSYSGNAGKVSYKGSMGYVPLNHLSEASAKAEQAQTEQAPEEPSEKVEKYDNVPVVTAKEAKVYSKPSTSSAAVTVPKGTKMTLVAVKGACAMVKWNSRTAYIASSVLQVDTAPATAASESSSESSAVKTAKAEDSVFSGSNEQIIYKFLVGVAGYNSAAACGIMANIRYESGYKPTSGGDSGSSYGIVQWHAGRKTRLIKWCDSNGYDHTTLKGQLYFLQYELKTYYPSVHNRLKAVANTEQGAYDAGYDVCYYYEAPSNRASKAVTRGNYAKVTVWPRYKV